MKQKVVSVKNLVKKFSIPKSTPGFVGSVKSLFSRTYREIVAVNDIDFDIYREEIVAFIGPNGAGKTTTLKCLSGLLYPDSGNIDILGFKPNERKYDFLRKISLVMGNKSQLWWELPAEETFLLNKEIYQVDEKEYKARVGEMVEQLGIEEVIHIPVRKLSLGERMKCELVASLVHTPELLFLDEPTIGLDLVSQQKLRDFLREYNSRYKATMILTSHNMEDIKDLCKRTIVIDNGKVLYDGKISDLTKKFVKSKFVTFVLKDPAIAKEFESIGKLVKFDGRIGLLAVPHAEVTKCISKLLSKFEIEDLGIEDPGLDVVVKNIFNGEYIVKKG